MSLLRPIIRALAVAAIRDQTWAAGRVYDSDLRPFATAVLGQEAPQPYCVVYTDADDEAPVVVPSQLLSGENRSISLVVEIGSANAVRKGAGGPITVQFALTDEGQELVVDVLETQVVAALFTNPYSMWGDLLKRCIVKPRRYITRRGGQNQAGVRFAARRLTFFVQPLWEMSLTMLPPPNSVIWDFIKLADQYPAAGCKDVADAIQFLLPSQNAPEWRTAQSHLGMFTKAVKMLNVPGSPLPWGQAQGEVPVEQPPYDAVSVPGSPPLGTIPSDEYVPVTQELDLSDQSQPPGTTPPYLGSDIFFYD